MSVLIACEESQLVAIDVPESRGWAVVLGGQVVEYARKAGSAKRRALELSRGTGKQAVIRCLDVGWHPAGEWVIRESEEGG